ncbi:hypothetical protein BDQ12DRAFT_672507, partial [Crucibulum laeve]
MRLLSPLSAIHHSSSPVISFFFFINHYHSIFAFYSYSFSCAVELYSISCYIPSSEFNSIASIQNPFSRRLFHTDIHSIPSLIHLIPQSRIYSFSFSSTIYLHGNRCTYTLSQV